MSAGQLSLDVLGAPSEAPATSPTRVLEDYWTPPELATAIVRALGIGVGDQVLEPHAGGGAFVRALLDRRAEVYACDIADVPAAGMVRHWRRQDFLDPLPAGWHGFDAVVGNPPFGGWETHARRALEVVRPAGLVCLIVPVSVLHLQKHAAFFAEFPPDRELRIMGRPWTVVRECSALVWRRDAWRSGGSWRCERLEWRR